MKIFQKEFNLAPRKREFHIVTDEVMRNIPEIHETDSGLAHIFICHTSASLTLNENVSPDVRDDFESCFNTAVPENASYYRHTIEGSDDIPISNLHFLAARYRSRSKAAGLISGPGREYTSVSTGITGDLEN